MLHTVISVEFSKSKIKFLGQSIEASGVSADPKRCEGHAGTN